MSRVQDSRPLSPHLSVYRWQITNTLSILHRLTGFGLALGLFPFAAWLWGVAYDAQMYDCLNQFFSSIVGKIFLFGWTAAFYYHLANGMRHLNWDIGKGFKIEDATASGQVVIAFTLSLTIFTWILVCRKVGIHVL